MFPALVIVRHMQELLTGARVPDRGPVVMRPTIVSKGDLEVMR